MKQVGDDLREEIMKECVQTVNMKLKNIQIKELAECTLEFLKSGINN